MPMIQRIIMTSGEPAGIGPELMAQIAAASLPVEWVVLGDPSLLVERARQCGITVSCQLWQPEQPVTLNTPGVIKVWPVALQGDCQPGVLNPENSPYVLEQLSRGAEACVRGQFAALVTGPVHKGIINEWGMPFSISFSGQTEFLAQLTHTPDVVMMLVAGDLRVALATTHLPLKEVPKAITAKGLTTTLSILYKALRQDFGIQKPRVYVCGLNPHAGEGGHLGREEMEIIAPVLEALRQGWEGALVGPLPADTLFTPPHLQGADSVLAMYHDQGLPVLKYQGFGHAVNITLGLPIIRTSVDHGTALTLAGTGKANTGSLLAAVDKALMMIKQRANNEQDN